MSDKKYVKNFVVKLNWMGVFEVMVEIIGIIGSIVLFKYMCSNIPQNNEELKYVIACLCMPVGLIFFCLWAVTNQLFTGIEVHENKLLIKRPFKKNRTIDVSEITKYTNKEAIQKGHRYFYIDIYYDEKESIEIKSDIYKNYDLLSYYLNKNVPQNKKA